MHSARHDSDSILQPIVLYNYITYLRIPSSEDYRVLAPSRVVAATQHLIYWWMTADARLGKATQRIVANAEIIVSAVSIWEMVLKNSKGNLPLPQGSIAEALEAQGFILLPILPRHIDAARDLQCAHTDPFDRLLIAQARDEKLTLLTRDAAILGLQLQNVAKG